MDTQCLSGGWTSSWDSGCCARSSREGRRWLMTSCLHLSQPRDGFGSPEATFSPPWEVQRGNAAAWTQILNVLFAPPPVDKEGRSVFSQSDVSSQSGAEMQSAAMQSSPVTFRWQRDILYLSAFKETAGLAACWQRKSTPFLCRTSLQMFTGTKHKRQLSVICLWSLKICKSLIKFTVKMGTVWRYKQSTKTTTSCLQMFC